MEVNETMHNPTFRVMEILKLISRKGNLTLTDISCELDFSKSTIQPILKTLEKLGYITEDKDRRTFKIGVETFKLSQNFLSENTSFDIIKSHMKEIVKECNEICQMGIYSNSDSKSVTYVAKEDPDQSVALISSIGVSLPAHATALGKCLLSTFSNEYIRKLYESGMEKLTDHTVSDIDGLIGQIESIRKNEYFIEVEEATEGIMCVAVPLIQDNKVVAALSVSLPIYRSSEEKIEFIRELLMKSKKDIDTILVRSPLQL